jgi:hypothetical protein
MLGILAIMLPRIRKILFAPIILGVFLVATSCDCDTDPQPEEFVCGCEAELTDTTFQDIPALVVATSRGYYLLNVDIGFISVCNVLPEGFQQDGLLVRASGIVRSTCKMVNNPYRINETFADIQTIRVTTDSVFDYPNLDVSIINSEDYGYEPGFGYSIIPPSGSGILQPTQPAISGEHLFERVLMRTRSLDWLSINL